MVLGDSDGAIKALLPRIFDPSNDELTYWMSLIRSYPTFVLKKGGHLVGLANVQPRHTKSKRTAHITLLGVAPKHQGNGYGKILLELSEGFGKRIGAETVNLHTEQRKPENVAFYSKDGFRVIDVIPKYYRDRGDGLHMEKIVTASVVKPVGQKKRRRRPPRKKRGHKCAETFGDFPEVISCENLSDVLPQLSEIRDRITTTSSKSKLGCLNRMANKISAKCRRNKLVKPMILSIKREINGSVQRKNANIKHGILS